jgi:hypothetical protein
VIRVGKVSRTGSVRAPKHVFAPEPARTLLSSHFCGGDPFRWACLPVNSTDFVDILVYML